MVTKAKKALLASLAAFLCVMLTVFGLSMSVSLSETAKAADETSAVAQVGSTTYETLNGAIGAANEGDTVTLLKDTTEDVVVDKNITLDLGGKTLTGTNSGKATLTIAKGATATVKNGSVIGTSSFYNIQNNGTATFESLTATAGNTGSSMLDNWGTLTITSGTYTGGMDTVKSEEGSKLTINGGKFKNSFGKKWSYTATILVYGDTLITGGEFIQETSNTSSYAKVVMTGVVDGYTSITKVTGGSFTSTRGIFWALGDATSDNFEVSGGTFNKSISEGFCADGFIPTRQADGTYGVKEGKYVAKIGSKKYETLADAIRLAANGKTVTLLDNITLTEQLVIGKALTIDLGGFTLTSNYSLGASGADRYAIVLNAAVTIKNGKIVANNARVIGAYAAMTMDGVTVENGIQGGHATIGLSGAKSEYVIRKSTIDGAYSVSIFANNATVTITDSKLIGRGNTLYHNGSNYGLKLTVTGTEISSSASCGVYISGSTAAQSDAANQNGAGGYQQATFTRCTISGTNGIEVKYTNLTLDSCNVSTTENTPSYNQDNNGPAASGFAVVSTDNAMGGTTPAPKGTIAVSGEGNYVGAIGIGTLIKNTYEGFEDASYAVSGGTFTNVVPAEYCANGFIPTQNADGTYGVKVGVAEVNGVKYETLQAAIDAAARNATVTLLANTRENVTIAKNITLDLNGYTINGGTVAGKATVTVTARVTIKDSSASANENGTGTIMREDTAENSGVSSHYVIDVQGGGWLMFEGGNVINHSGVVGVKGASLVRIGDDSVDKYPGLTIKGGTFTQDNFIVIKVDRGYFTLNGGTLNSANTYAIENWFRATVKNGTVNGAVSSWTYSGGSNSTLEIIGGTINGDVTSVNYGNATDKKARVSVTGGTINGMLDTRSYDPATGDLTSINDATKATIGITGGTFSTDPTKYVVEDSAITENEDGTYGVKKAYLAKVGDTSYYTMEEAFKAQTASGEAIVMLRDYTTGSTFNSGTKHRVVDLNGHTWTYTGTDMNSAAFEINNPNATLTVKNGKIISNTLVGLIPSAMGGTIKYDNAGLVFEKVEMTSKGHSGIETNGNNTNDSVTLINSTLNVPNGFGIYFPSSGTLTIDNSTINAKTMGVQVCSGVLNINAGSAITVSGDAVPKAENDGAIQDGAAISIVNRPGYKGLSNIVITGGTFTAKAGKALKAYDWVNKVESEFTKADHVAVSGGTFTSAVPAEYCADRFIPTQNEDGTYGVKEGTYVAKIGEVGYETLAEAIAAATDGQTVMLLTRVAENVVIDADKNFTLDLNGFTLNGGTGNKNAAILNNGTLVITDSSAAKTGTIKREDNGDRGYYVILNLGTMTIEQANVVNNSGHDGSSLIRNGGNDKGANLTINGGKLTQLNFIAIKNDANGILVVNGGEITSNQSAIQNWYNATITGGTIKGQLWTDAWTEGGSVGNTVIGGNVDYEGEIVMDVTGSSIKPTLTVNGGNLSVTNWRITTACAKLGGKPAVSGGTFSSEVNKDYLAKGYRLTKTGDSYSATEKYIASSTVSLGVDLSFKYEMVKGKSVNRVVASYYKVNETEATEYELTNVTIDGVVYYVFNGITPQMIDRKISVNVYVGNTVIYDVVEYSILDNLGAVLKKELGSKQDVTRQLVASLAYYGKAAMEYVKYDSSAVQKFIDDNKLSPLTAEIKDGVVAEYDPNETKIARISVQFADTNKVLVGVDEKVFDNYNYTIMVNGQEITSIDWQTGVVSGYNVYVSEGFAARYITDASKYVEVEVLDKNNNNNRVQYVKYNVAGYCMMMKDNATMGALATATYYYGVAAANYAA